MVKTPKQLKIALVHDYLKEAGGAERVLRVLVDMYPDTRIFTAFIVRDSRVVEMFSDREVVESKWGWWLKRGRLYSWFRFVQPWVWQSLDLSEYDLVITSCSGYIARGFKVSKKTKVVAYCHTPPKWLYGYETPTRARKKWWGQLYLWLFGLWIRYFDYQSAQRVDKWIANSQEVARRIKKFYRREAEVVYPPIELSEKLQLVENNKRKDYYLVVGRLVGAKGLELAIEACQRMKRRLMVVGEGVRSKQVQKIDSETVKYLGWVSDEKLGELYSEARGYLALAQDEDFGMTVVEAMMMGTPVVALASGGYKETVNKKVGVLVDEFTVEGVIKGMEKLEKKQWNRKRLRQEAEKYKRSRFEREIKKIIKSVVV